MKTLFVLLILIILSALLWFATKATNLEKYESRLMAFEDLPPEVGLKYLKVYQATESSADGNILDCYSLDADIDFTHEYTGMDDGLLVLLLRGPNHHLYLNNKHFKIKSNQGMPYILKNNKIYFPDSYSVTGSTVQKTKYFEFDLDRLKK